MKSEVKFVHDIAIHNLSSPRIIIPILFKYFRPTSVVDIGCGTGRFLKAFKELGVNNVMGVDGNWVNRELLKVNLDENEFFVTDLEKFSYRDLNKKYDLALCLEVAEHIDKKFSDLIVENLTSLSDYILFSAAVPYQGGQHHVNEQWSEYWREKFEARGFAYWDVLRNELWDAQGVQSWFKQNLFLVVRKEKLPNDYDSNQPIRNYIHPDLFLSKAIKLNDVMKGNYSILFYLKGLIKSLIALNIRKSKRPIV